MRILFCLVALACAESTDARYTCRLSDEKLMAIARRDQSDECNSSRRCDFRVMAREKDYWCAVQVFYLPEEPGEVLLVGNFVTLVISNAGKVVKRVPGV